MIMVVILIMIILIIILRRVLVLGPLFTDVLGLAVELTINIRLWYLAKYTTYLPARLLLPLFGWIPDKISWQEKSLASVTGQVFWNRKDDKWLSQKRYSPGALNNLRYGRGVTEFRKCLSIFCPLLIDYVPEHCSVNKQWWPVLTSEYREKILFDDGFDDFL